MKRLLVTGAGLLLLAGCGGSSDPVGENSAGSVTTTAVGNVVATIPSPTPTPTEAPLPTSTATVVSSPTDTTTNAAAAAPADSGDHGE
jgi:hypothetical protein